MQTESPLSVALIDIGTNSVKLLIAGVSGREGFRVLFFSRVTTRLGAGLQKHGGIKPSRLGKTLDTLTQFQRIIENHSCKMIFAFSTHVLREATNAGAVLEAIEEKTGIRVKILTGKAEAYFAFLSARNRLQLDKPGLVLVDIGGGSTELVYAHGDNVEFVSSIPLGALFLTEHFLKSDPVEDGEYRLLESHIDSTIRHSTKTLQLPGVGSPDVELIVSGGAASSAVRMITQESGKEFNRSESLVIKRIQLESLLNKCLSLPLHQRKTIPGLDPDRADIIVAGLAVILSVMRKLETQNLRINEGGLREGVLYAIIQNGLRWPDEIVSRENH